MSAESNFLAASKAAESWLNTVSLVAQFGENGSVDLAFWLLLPGADDLTRPNLLDSYSKHAGILIEMTGKLAALSDGAIRWEHGRGRSAIARVPKAVYPHVWSSAHEAATGIARLTLDLLVSPLEGISKPTAQKARAKKLLSARWKAIVVPVDEVAVLQERIRRERAKLLVESKSDGASDPPDNWADYRSGPGGPLLTAAACKDRFGVSNPVLSKAAKDDRNIRRKNPEGRGFVYRYDVVARISNRKSGDD